MKIKVAVLGCLNCSRLVAVVLCLIWLFFVTRYLDIRPEYATREYLKLFQQSPKNNGIIRMSSYFSPKTPQQSPSHQKPPSQMFYYFNFLQLSQQKSRIQCETTTNVLLINANYKTIGDSYLSLYKQLQKLNIHCRHSIHELNRRDHLLMNSELMIEHYAMEVAMTIQMIAAERDKLVVVTFQEGCVVVIKALEILGVGVIQKLRSILFINAYNPHLEILYEPPYRYIHKIQQNLLQDEKKMTTLNETEMIFISTVDYFDNNVNKEEDEEKYKFLWKGKKLHNSLFLSTRFMKNIHFLMHQRDYFSNGNLSTRIAKYISLSEGPKKRKIQAIQYFFNYGQLYVKLDQDLKQIKKKHCFQSRLSTLNKFTKIFSTPCLTINVMEKLKQKDFQNNTALIVASKKAYIFNNKYERLQPMFQSLQNSYYLIDKITQTTQLTLINLNRSQINVPISNPIPPQIHFESGANLFLNNSYKQYFTQRKIIKVCPNGQQLIFPEHFNNLYPDHSMFTVLAIYRINKILYDYFGILGRFGEDCYSDYFTQVVIVPKEILLDWHRQRNIVLFLLILGYVRKQSIYHNFYIYLILLTTLRLILTQSPSPILNLLLLSTSILIQKSIQITIHLVKFIQEMIDIRYRMMMLILILVLALLKIVNRSLAEIQNLSAWKILFISLIFVVNRENMLVLVMKLYFLGAVILYNHNDFFEIGVVLTWIYISLHDSIDAIIQQRQKKIRQLFLRRQGITQTDQTPTPLQTLLALSFLLLIDGPSHFHNSILTIYILIKFVGYSWNMLKQSRNLIA